MLLDSTRPVTVLTLEYRLLKRTTAGYNCSHVSTL